MDAAKRPNVLFICADQWRGDCLSGAGHPTVRTPNLDRLAAGGVLFKKHFGQCTPCGPSRVSLLTGLYLMNHRSGRNGTPLDARHTNIALEARKGGYDPALFGYTDTSPDPRGKHPRDPALTAYDEGVIAGFTVPVRMSERMDPWVADLIARGHDLPRGREDVYRSPRGAVPPAGRGFRFLPTRHSADESETAFLTDAFLKWHAVRGERPWFAHLVYYRPHPPLIAPEPYNAMYDPARIPLPNRAASVAEEADNHPFAAGALALLSVPGAYDENSPLDPVHADDLEILQMRAAYFGLITEVDANIGSIVERLKTSGDYDNTLIVFTSDHAELLGEHHLWGKEAYFDGAFHLPLIIRDPRPEAVRGVTIDAFTEAIDVMPTILDWLGLETPRACDGRSLQGFLRGEAPANWRGEIFFEHDFRDVAGQTAELALGLSSDQCCYAVIRDHAYKYVHFAGLGPLLFDLAEDPHELRNLAARPEMTGVLLRYAQKMLDWRLVHADRTLTNMALTPAGLVSRP